MADYQGFDDVLNELSISEGELNRLVSEGALRAYRDEGNMKFRKEDVKAMKHSNMGAVGSTPTMSPTELGRELEVRDETDETLLDLDEVSEDVDFEDTGETSVPTIDLGSDVGGTDALTDELSFDDGDILDLDDGEATIMSDDGLTLGDDDLGLETEPLAGLDDADATMIVDDEITLDDELNLQPDDLSLDGGYGRGYDTPGFVPQQMHAPQIQVQERFKYVEIVSNEPIWTKIISGLLLVVLVFGFIAYINNATGSNTFGTAEMGFNMVTGKRSENPKMTNVKYPEKPLTAGPNAVMSAGTNPNMDGQFFAGEVLHRNANGKAHSYDSSNK